MAQVFEPRLRPYGSHRARGQGSTASGRGCWRPRRWWPSCVLPRSVPDRGERCGRSCLFVDYLALAFHAHILHTYGNGSADSASKRGGLALWQVRRACEFIEAKLEGDPSIADIAAECGLSSSHFAKAFKQTTGAPPHAWLSMKRIERAKQLMNGTNLELAEIALACGFVDQSHFTRTFVRKVGCSPGKWRRLLRTNR
jgi:AraC family transcriptional regulator